MSSIVLHGAHLRRCAECIRHPPGGALVIRRKRNPDMAIIEDGVIWPVGSFELIQALCDQEAADAVARHECKLALEEVEAAEGRELIEHQQEFLPPSIGIQALGQPPSNLVKDEAHQGFGASDVGWR